VSSQNLRGSPPTTYAILALLEGEDGALGRVVWATVRRALFVAPGLFIAGVKNPQRLALQSFAASASITACLTAYYALGLHKK
jgi:hypothetical protein